MGVRDICEKIFATGEKTLFEKGFVPSTFFLIKDASIIPLPIIPLNSVRERALVGSFVSITAKEIDADGVVLISETWVVKQEINDKAVLDVPPSQHPDKEEILMLLYMEATGLGGVCMDQIIRNNDEVFTSNRKKWMNFNSADDEFVQGIFYPWRK